MKRRTLVLFALRPIRALGKGHIAAAEVIILSQGTAIDPEGRFAI